MNLRLLCIALLGLLSLGAEAHRPSDAELRLRLQQQTLTEQADCSAVNLTLLQNITMADNGSVTAQKKEARGPLLQQLLLLAK